MVRPVFPSTAPAKKRKQERRVSASLAGLDQGSISAQWPTPIIVCPEGLLPCAKLSPRLHMDGGDMGQCLNGAPLRRISGLTIPTAAGD
jgi:hypothetical protein